MKTPLTLLSNILRCLRSFYKTTISGSKTLSLNPYTFPMTIDRCIFVSFSLILAFEGYVISVCFSLVLDLKSVLLS